MPFERAIAANVGTSPVALITVAAGKVATLIDCSCANVEPGGTEVKGTVRQVVGATTINLVKGGPVPVGSAMVVVGAPRKVVLKAGDQLVALCDKAGGMDVAVSYLEQTA
jgi:hypothetical protein